MYDKDADQHIKESELFLILKLCVGSNIEEAQLKMLVQGTLQDADKNGDKVLDYIEFRQCVERNTNIAEKLTIKF